MAADVRYGQGGQTRFVATVAERVKQHPAGERTYVYPGHAYEPAAWGWRIPCIEHRRMPHVELRELKSRLGVGGNPNTWHGLLEVKDVAAFDALVAEHTASYAGDGDLSCDGGPSSPYRAGGPEAARSSRNSMLATCSSEQ